MPSAPADSVDALIALHRSQIDDYLGSVQGLYAFADSARWDTDRKVLRTGSYRCIPRTMTRVEEEGLKNVTPDCVVQVSPSYGIVAEMKKHYRDPSDTSGFKQLSRYDFDLLGWWTEDERMEVHDLVLLTHYLSSTRAADAFRKWQAEGGEFRRRFALVEFSFVDQADRWFTLKRTAGQLSDKIHDEDLRQGKPVPNHLALTYISKYKFYDATPPLIHVMVLLHDYIFPMLLAEDDFEGELSETGRGLRVSIELLRERLEQQFCDTREASRQPVLPKAQWVRDAMEAFLKIGLVRRVEEADLYLVSPRRPAGRDTVEYLTRALLRAEEARMRGTGERTDELRQANLFEDEGGQEVEEGG